MTDTLPIVGQPVTVNELNILASVTCKCQPDNLPILILGVAQGMTCLSCKKTYIIVKAQFDKSADPTTIHGAVGYILGS